MKALKSISLPPRGGGRGWGALWLLAIGFLIPSAPAWAVRWPTKTVVPRWSVELLAGSPHNFTTPLSIEQDGFADIDVDAEYETRPFENPQYYVFRISRWIDERAWELELVHHKVYLKNKPAGVGHFAISHGYNLLTVNRAWLGSTFVWRLGAGAVVSHPESVVRGRSFDEYQGFLDKGFYVSGACAQAAVSRSVALWRSLFATLEGKLTYGWARVPIAGGHAIAPNAALHGAFGLGWNF